MQEQPDNDAAQEGLDRLFRKSAEEFKPPYEPAAWPIMLTKLDEHDRIMAWGRVLRWALALMALMVMVSGGWYGLRQLGSEPDMAEAGVPQRITSKQSLPIDSQFPKPKNVVPKRVGLQPNQNIAGRHIDNQPMRIRASQQRRVVSWPVVRQQSLSEPEKRVINFPNPNAEPLGSRTQIGSDGKMETDQLTDLKGRFKRKNRAAPLALVKLATIPDRAVKNSAGPDAAQSGLNQVEPGAAEPKQVETSPKNYGTDALLSDAATVGNNENFRIGPVDALNSRDALHWPEWSELAIPAFAQSVSEPAGNKSSKPLRDRGLSIRGAVSPDLSAIGLKNFAKPGTNYGLLVEYRFNKRFSAQAGFFQSNKVYKATPDQYEWPTRWAGWKVKPIGVQATCTMFDIPINLRYDLVLRPLDSGRPPARWFVSSGITTYIMKKEKYDYSYENPEDPLIRVRTWSTKTGRYNFSNLNLSMGYERPINRRFSWQVEPFMKVPLKQVGYFKINLLSTGAFLSMRYRL